MDTSRVLLLTLLCGWFSRISGAEVKKRVRLGDNVTLYCDCVIPNRSNLVWLRQCSDDSHPPHLLKSSDAKHFSFVRNSSSRTYDLLVKNISKKDLGKYYCARQENKATSLGTVYHHGNLTTQISLEDSSCEDSPQTTSTPPVSDCSVCWKLLVSVCPLCVLLSSLLTSACIFCICRSRTKAVSLKDIPEKRKNDEVREENEDVCYASLDLPSRGQKRLMKKKTRVESSNFSTYSEVKTDR